MKNLTFLALILEDERGTAMTEFVITVPVFIFLFVGLLSLGNISQGAVAAHTEAAGPLWRATFAAEKDQSRMSPRNQNWTSLPVGGVGNTIGTGVNRLRGHWGESYTAVTAMPLLTGKSLPNDAAGQDVRQKLTMDSTKIIGDSRAASGVADDTFRMSMGNWSAVGAGSGALLTIALNSITQMLGVNLGFGAGMRYGTVTSNSHTVVKRPLGLPDAHYNLSYTSLVSPSNTNDASIASFLPGGWVDDPEDRAYLASRLWVETEQPYRNLLGIYDSSRSFNGHASNAVPVIYQNYGTNPDNPWWCFWCQ